MGEFLAQPEISISRSYYLRLVQIWRDLVVVKGVAPARLSRIEPSKAQEVLPAIRRGKVRSDDALDDAQALSKSDLRAKYADGAQAPDDPIPLHEPVRCPTCRSWMTRDRLPDIEGTGREGGP